MNTRAARSGLCGAQLAPSNTIKRTRAREASTRPTYHERLVLYPTRVSRRIATNEQSRVSAANTAMWISAPSLPDGAEAAHSESFFKWYAGENGGSHEIDFGISYQSSPMENIGT